MGYPSSSYQTVLGTESFFFVVSPIPIPLGLFLWTVVMSVASGTTKMISSPLMGVGVYASALVWRLSNTKIIGEGVINLCWCCCCCCCCCCCFRPPVRVVCPNHEVVLFQPRTGTTPYLGSVANFTFYTSLPTPPVATPTSSPRMWLYGLIRCYRVLLGF